MLDAADIQHGGLADRVFSPLDVEEPPESLWWLSVHGIYRPKTDRCGAALGLTPIVEPEQAGPFGHDGETLVHPKYRVPACCFAYVGNASDPGTWKLPLPSGRWRR
jgi:hypothetical protein